WSAPERLEQQRSADRQRREERKAGADRQPTGGRGPGLHALPMGNEQQEWKENQGSGADQSGRFHEGNDTARHRFIRGRGGGSAELWVGVLEVAQPSLRPEAAGVCPGTTASPGSLCC